MQTKRLMFKTIDLDAHTSVCNFFRRDPYLCSFGKDRFFKEAGPNGLHYIERLRMGIAKFPDGYIYALLRPSRDKVNLMEHDMPANVGSNKLQLLILANIFARGIKPYQDGLVPVFQPGRPVFGECV
jgi:hypothetical protein